MITIAVCRRVATRKKYPETLPNPSALCSVLMMLFVLIVQLYVLPSRREVVLMIHAQDHAVLRRSFSHRAIDIPDHEILSLAWVLLASQHCGPS